MKKLFMVIGVLIVIPSLCFSAAAKESPKETLVMAENTEIFKNFDPGICFEVLPSAMTNNLYAKLVKVVIADKKFKAVPDLAEKWEQSKDGKTWTFTLRKGAKFDTGDPVKASDVVYSFKRAIKLKKSPAWLFTDVIGLTEAGVSAPNDQTVQIVTNGAPSNVVLTIMGATIGGVLNEKVVKAHEANNDMGEVWLADHSAGAGPYVLQEWARKIRVVFTANKNYYGGIPKTKTVILQDIPEPTDRLLALKKGDIDVAWQLTAEQANSLKSDANFKLVTTPGQSDEYVAVNAKWGPFKDVRVRQAIKYAIDYQAIIDKVRMGFAINNQQFLPVGYFGYVENNPFKRDVQKAKQLLAEAGYANGFEVELVTNESNTRKSEAVIVQSNLAEIGIKANVVIMQASQMYDKYRAQGLQMIVAGWGVDYPDADALAQPFANQRVKQLAWRNGWEDDKAADMAEAAAKELDEQKRFQIYQDLTKYWFENGPFAMLYQPIQYWVVRKEVNDFDKAADGYAVHFDLTLVSK